MLTTTVKSGVPRTLFYNNEAAIECCAFSSTDHVCVCTSYFLAVDIYKGLSGYDGSLIKQGLKDGWLILIVNPTKWEESNLNKLEALRAIKSNEPIPEGYYRLHIIPRKVF
jgi:hypothetical protein